MPNDFSWKAHVTIISASANKTLGFLKCHLCHALPHIKQLAYKSLVLSKLQYGCAIWNPNQIYLTVLEAVHSFCILLNISTLSLKAPSGLEPLSFCRRIATLSLFHILLFSTQLRTFHHPTDVHISPNWPCTCSFRSLYPYNHVRCLLLSTRC